MMFQTWDIIGPLNGNEPPPGPNLKLAGGGKTGEPILGRGPVLGKKAPSAPISPPPWTMGGSWWGGRTTYSPSREGKLSTAVR